MKVHKVVLTVLFLLSLNSFAKSSTKEGNVYICKGKGSKRYHYRKSCRGLSNCSTKIYQVPLSKAKELGRTLCGWED